MAIQLFKKIASKLLGKDGKKKNTTTAQSKNKAGQKASSGASTRGESGRRVNATAEMARERGSQTRRERIKRSVQGSTDGESQERRRQRRPKRGATEQVSHNEQRYQGQSRDERGTRGGRSQLPRGDRGRSGRASAPLRSVNSDPQAIRPGGAVGELEMEQRRSDHDGWTLEQFKVEPVEGKRRFHEFDLPLEIMHALSDLGFEYCTPIQALSLEHSLAGKNVAGRAQTGTGKTAAFLLAILTRYLRTPQERQSKSGAPRALVIAPTRELVIQICKDADELGKYCGLRYLAVYGGMDHERQRRELQAGPVDLLVATPGRLLDFVNGRVVDLSNVDTLVIDEADRMLDMGFIPDVRRIIFRLPGRERRCTMLYSATLTEDVMRLASQWMTEPVRVEVDADNVTIDTVRQVVYIVRAREKFTVLYNLLRQNPEERVLVFCNRRSSTERVSENLIRLGVPCEVLSGDVQQNKRLRVLEDFRSGKVRVVVATDVAGRGLHVDGINFVVNYDFPYEADDYVHRIGRTGRAGNTGTAISFADEDESFIIPDIEEYIGEPLKCTMPEPELLEDLPQVRGSRGGRAPRVAHGEQQQGEQRQGEIVPEQLAAAAAAAQPEVAPAAVRRPKPVAEEQPAVTVRESIDNKPAPTTPRRPVAEEWVPGQ